MKFLLASSLTDWSVDADLKAKREAKQKNNKTNNYLYNYNYERIHVLRRSGVSFCLLLFYEQLADRFASVERLKRRSLTDTPKMPSKILDESLARRSRIDLLDRSPRSIDRSIVTSIFFKQNTNERTNERGDRSISSPVRPIERFFFDAPCCTYTQTHTHKHVRA